MRGCAPWRVALVVIARDEASRIGRLLASVRDHVDEMLVLDTGSIDETVAVALGQGARVERFAWVDDFSAARNAALNAAAADWHVVMDADEWLVAGGDTIRELRHRVPAFVGSVLFDDHFIYGQARVGHGRISRILPGHVRYAGRVHEQPVHALPVQQAGVRFGHDGYLPEALLRKRGRNRALLTDALRDRPNDGYLWYQTGKDAQVYDEYTEAEVAFAHAADHCTRSEPWWCDLVARRLFSLKRLGRYEDGLRCAEQELAVCLDSPDVCFALGDLLLDWAVERPHLSGDLLPMIEASWKQCLEIGERPAQTGAIRGRGSYLAAHNLVVMLREQGRGSEADEIIASMRAANLERRIDR
jgi:hypothetical protein